MKKLIVYGPIAMALIAALAVGIPAAVAADSSDAAPTQTAVTDEQRPGQEIISRAAEILGIDEETVGNAFRQATQEMMTERHQERLQNAVENGLITEEEAAEIQSWMNAEPAAAEILGQGWLNRLMRPSGNSYESGSTNAGTPSTMDRGFPGGMMPSGNSSAGAPANMGRGFPGMRPSGNTSDSQPANMGNMPGGSTLSTEGSLQSAVDNGTITQAESDEITTWINAMPDAMSKIDSLGDQGQGRGRGMGSADDFAFCAP